MPIAPDDLSDLEGQWMHVTHAVTLASDVVLEGAIAERQSYAQPWRLKECVFFRQHGLVLVFDRGLLALGELVLQWRHVMELVPVSTDVLARSERRVYEG